MSGVLILDEHATINKIKQGYSLSRYGDGEFFCLLKASKGISKLQKFDKDLREKLFTVFSKPLEKLLIGIPRMDRPSQWVIKFNDIFFRFINNKPAYKESTFVSAFVSRPSVINKSTEKYFDDIKSIWRDRKIVLVNFNLDIVNHCLFKENARDFIQIPRKNCFNNYTNILSRCERFCNQKKLFLISAGPTATCLAYDLTFKGEQCIDIGQIAFEYSLFKNEKNLRTWTSQNEYRRK